MQFPASWVTHMQNPVENADPQKRVACLEISHCRLRQACKARETTDLTKNLRSQAIPFSKPSHKSEKNEIT